jgi:hypothetical protein
MAPEVIGFAVWDTSDVASTANLAPLPRQLLSSDYTKIVSRPTTHVLAA